MRESTIPRPPRQKPRGRELERLVLAECGRHNSPVVLEHVAQAALQMSAKLIAVPGPCDFFGTIRGTGRAIVFDCKECADATSFNASHDHLPQHQVNQLVQHGQAGAVAGLLILLPDTRRIYWLDWTRLVQRHSTYRWDSMPIVGTHPTGVWWGWIASPADRGQG